MAKAALPKTSTVVSLKVTLRDTKPPIWRRLLTADTMTLADLHKAIQGAMGWHETHISTSSTSMGGNTATPAPSTTLPTNDASRSAVC